MPRKNRAESQILHFAYSLGKTRRTRGDGGVAHRPPGEPRADEPVFTIHSSMKQSELLMSPGRGTITHPVIEILQQFR